MKRVFIGAILILSFFTVFAVSSRSDDLTLLWKEFDFAQQADKPQKELELLSKIGEIANKQHLPYDYYRYLTTNIIVRTNINWKLSDSLSRDMRIKVQEFDEPILSFVTGYYDCSAVDFLSLNESRLRTSSNTSFYISLGELQSKCVRNDYEFLVWQSGNDELFIATLKERFSEDAVQIYSDSRSLSSVFSRIVNDSKSTEADYLKLYESLVSYRKRCDSFKGADADLVACWDLSYLERQLKETSFSAQVKNDTLLIRLRNLSSVELKIKQDKKSVHSATVKNPSKRFYIIDTVNYPLPLLDDGTYSLTLSNGSKNSFDYEFVKHSISVAQRHDAGGYSLFVTDSRSGRPLEKVSVSLYKGEKFLSTVDNFTTRDGFTYLPADFQEQIDANRRNDYCLSCSYKDGAGRLRISDKVFCRNSSVHEPIAQVYSQIFLDRTFCKPGDTLHFKVLSYVTDENYDSRVLENETVNVRIADSRGKTFFDRSFKTNSFGTAAGLFAIPVAERNGSWAISAECRQTRTSAYFSVEEAVLPSFEAVFEPQKAVALYGESITVAGVIKGYGGHNLSSANARYSVNEYGNVISSGEVEIDASGHFAFSFTPIKTHEWNTTYQVSLKIADLTGETLEFYTERRIAAKPTITVTSHNQSLYQKSCNIRLAEFDERHSQPFVADSIARLAVNSDFGPLPVSYRLTKNGQTVLKGECKANSLFDISLSALSQGLYRLEAEGGKDSLKCEASLDILKISPDATTLDAKVSHLFLPLDLEVPTFLMGTTTAPMWASVSLHGKGNLLLANRLVYLKGEEGRDGSLAKISFDGISADSGPLSVDVLYFRDNSTYKWRWCCPEKERNSDLPLKFTRFHQNASPASQYKFEIKTAVQTEAVATVFDKALEAMSPNEYSKPQLNRHRAPYINTVCSAGSEKLLSVYVSVRSMGTARANKTMSLGMEHADCAPLAEEAIANQAFETNIPVRSDFRTTLAFEPFLRSDANGNMSFEVNTSDKTSTYIIQLFAHDKQLNSSIVKKEMVVSVPVEVAIIEPRFLYAGDRYVLKAKLSNSIEHEVAGTVKIELYSGGDYTKSEKIGEMAVSATADAMKTCDFEKEIVVPSSIDTLGIKVTFASDNKTQASDAVFVKVPVYAAHQTITESHSGVLLAGADRDALLEELRSLFVNGRADDAVVKEISIREMLAEALPQQIDTTVIDAVSAAGALMAACKVEGLKPGSDFSAEKARLAARLEACRNADGGYGWTPGMTSNAIVTAVVLERLACTEWADGLAAAVHYLDNAFVAKDKQKCWWSGISLSQYLYVRSMYSSVEFDAGSATAKELKAFRKSARNYLAPRGDRGLQGVVLAKTRRALTLRNLSDTEAGTALAKSWGIRLASASRIEKSLAGDIASLREYMVEHRSGGAYYPNAVMPWRGLLEGELYAHTLLHRLLGDDRIAVWMMVQKETQQWKSDPAYVDALAEVLSSGDEALQTKVLAVTASWDKPFSQIAASGNGMAVSRTYMREETGEDGIVHSVALKDGDMLHIGDKVTVKYDIWNEENRSFVRLTACRPASLRAENQFSGYYGWSPSARATGVWFTPQGYRNVKTDATEYWFDVYPEAKSSVSETFYVTQKGRFATPSVVIESLYAPHYRANDKPSPLSSN